MFWRFPKVIFLVFFLAVFGGFFLFAKKSYFYSANPPLRNPFLEKSETILGSLNLEQKIGQLFIVGLAGQTLEPETEELLREIHPGGILLLQRNIKNKEQVKNFIASLQKISLQDTGLPLFIAIDQEGGIVSRADWIEKTPQSKIKNEQDAYNIGKERGSELAEAGININLAPLLDRTRPGDFIFERCFQDNFKLSAKLGAALALGQREGGIFIVLKHFPGYFSINFNPEEKLAKVGQVPDIGQFKEFFSLGQAQMVMTSNVIYDEIDKKLPFTFSSSGIDFLQRELKGDYLIVSDDLAQNSLLKEFSLEEIVTLPVKAGVDILIFSGWRVPVGEGVSALLEEVKKGKISEERINQSVLKIIKAKQDIKNLSRNEI